MNKFQCFYHNFNHEAPAEEQFEEALHSGIIKSYFLTTMAALNARRVTDFCLWCDEIWSVGHKCECAPDYNCRFTFGEDFEGMAFVKLPRCVLKTLDVNDLLNESRHSSAHNVFDEVSKPATSCLKEDDTSISDAHKVLDEMPLPEFIREMADAANIIPDLNSIECELMEPILRSDEFQTVMISDKASPSCKNHEWQTEVKSQEQIVGLFDNIHDIFEVQSGWNLAEQVRSRFARKLIDKMPEPKSKVMTFEPQGTFIFDPGVLFLYLYTNPYTRLTELNIGRKANVNYKEVHSWDKLYAKLTLTRRLAGTIRPLSNQCYGIRYLRYGLIRHDLVIILRLDNNYYIELVRAYSKGLELDSFKAKCLSLAFVHMFYSRVCCILLHDHVEYMDALTMESCVRIELGSKEISYIYELSQSHSYDILCILVAFPKNSTQGSTWNVIIYCVGAGVVPEFFQGTKVFTLVFFFSLTLEDKGGFRSWEDKVYAKYQELFNVVVSWHTEYHKGMKSREAQIRVFDRGRHNQNVDDILDCAMIVLSMINIGDFESFCSKEKCELVPLKYKEVHNKNTYPLCYDDAMLKMLLRTFPFDPGEMNYNPSIFKTLKVVSTNQQGNAIVVVWVFDPGGYCVSLGVLSANMVMTFRGSIKKSTTLVKLDPCANDQELQMVEQLNCILEGRYGNCQNFVFDPGGQFTRLVIDAMVAYPRLGMCYVMS